MSCDFVMTQWRNMSGIQTGIERLRYYQLRYATQSIELPIYRVDKYNCAKQKFLLNKQLCDEGYDTAARPRVVIVV